jgi:glycosyltransferase involved in cell wall biosynthesis
MKSVGILSLDNQDIQTDARVQRQIKFLTHQYQVHVITYGRNEASPQIPAQSITIVGSLSDNAWPRRLMTIGLLFLGKLFGPWFYEKWYWNRPGHNEALRHLIELKVDIIQANDWWTLPVAMKAAEVIHAPVIFDMHEYSLDEYSTPAWQFFYKPVVEYIFRTYTPKISASITVNQMIANRYKEECGLDPIIIMNVPNYYEKIQFTPVSPDNVRLVSHGHAQRARQLERMIDIIALCDRRYSLTFILVGDPKYIQWLKKYAEENAPGRVHFLKGVLPQELPALLSQFDIGIYILLDNHFDFLASLPNKFFEFVSAGLAVCIGPSPAMSEIASQYDFGIVSPSFDPNIVANILNKITSEEVEAKKRRAIKAHETLNADIEMQKLLNLYTDIVKQGKE